MTTTIASTTNPETEYTVTIENGTAVHCQCIGHFYGHTCKHQKAVNADIQAEIEKAARFLAVKLQVQGMEETWKCQRDMAWDNRF